MSSWLDEYINVMNIKVGQVWHVARTKMDSSAEKRMMLLVEEKRRPHGQQWYWNAMDVATGEIHAITLWERGPDWKWERFA